MIEQADVIIVNWNSGPLLGRCIESLVHDAAAIERVIVVDNESSDGSEQVPVSGLPLTIIHAGRNLGFGRACNAGAALGRAPYILFLNPDAELFRHSLSRALAVLQSPEHRDVAVAGIQLLGRGGEVQRHCARFPSWRSMIAEATGLSRIAPRSFPPVIMTEFDHLSTRDVDHVIGAFYLIRRAVFEQIGGFDDSYFLYFEDLDLSRRVADLGLRRRFLADVGAYHRGGGTSEAIKARRLFLAISGRLTYARKHLGRTGAIAAWTAALLLEPLTRTVYAFLRGSPLEVLATWRAFGMLYRALPTLVRTSAPNRSKS
jgi:GT2 family glycosyltransferase